MILQKVNIEATRIGQKVRFLNKKAWWEVVDKGAKEIVIKRGKTTWRIGKGQIMLQKMFDNLND